jgi:hypothetical protein
METREKNTTLICIICFILLVICAAMHVHGQQICFKREITIATIDRQGKITGVITRKSVIVYSDKGRPIERVVSQTGKLKGIHDSRWIDLCVVPGFTPSLTGVRWSCALTDFREFRAPVTITEIGPYR